MCQVNQKVYIRLAALVIASLLLILTIPTVNAASGTCGDGLNWEMVGSVLTISGKGEMSNFTEQNPAPWSDLKITSVQIGSGVASVGKLAFMNMESITAVTLADSVQSVGDYAFYGCKNLHILNLGQGLQTIGESAFEQCASLMTLRLPASLQTMKQHAFYSCDFLQTVTVPSSVIQMGNAVFAYCTSLHTAIVNAQIQQLPVWTFYGCTALENVLLHPTIVETGAEAFAGSAMKEEPDRGTTDLVGNLIHNSTQTDDQGTVTDKTYEESPDSAISSQTGGNKTTINADLENENGWDDLKEYLKDTNGSAQVDVQLKGDTTVPGNALQQASGKNLTMQIQTAQGGSWIVKGKDLPLTGLNDRYDMSYKLHQLTKLNGKQEEVFGFCTVFSVTFNSDINFKTEVILPLGEEQGRHKAAFFVYGNGAYTCVQQVLVDNDGKAHFYLNQIKKGEEYLIGIDMPNVEVSPIIPEPLHQAYGVDQQEQIEYVILAPESSWGLNITQVTWILIAFMVGSVIVVGVVVGIMNKRKLKNGYIPQMDQEEETL